MRAICALFLLDYNISYILYEKPRHGWFTTPGSDDDQCASGACGGENLVDTHFNVMRRMSQVHFEQVTSWQGAKLAHERFVTDYNAQPHWAHRKWDDHRLSLAEVLGQETVLLSAGAALGVGGDFVAACQASPRLRSSKKTAKENRAVQLPLLEDGQATQE